jgi:hypothetical protein
VYGVIGRCNACVELDGCEACVDLGCCNACGLMCSCNAYSCAGGLQYL